MQPPFFHLRAARTRTLVLAHVLAAATVTGGCRDDVEPTEGVEPLGGAVAAGTPAATRIGQEILARGGNAADAAVAVSLALAVSEPGQSGLGGSAVALVRIGDGAPVIVSAPETVVGGGESGTPAAVVPALLPVLERLWRRHGSGALEWEELVLPAAELAEEGFSLGRLAHRTLVQEYPRLLADDGMAALFLTENRAIHAEGTVLTRPALAETLRRLARQGPGDLYRGELANDLAGWAADTGFPLSRSDLSSAPPAEESPAERGAYGEWTVWVAPAPFAGPAVLRGLDFLSRAPAGVWTAGPAVRGPWLAEALSWAYGAGEGDLDAHLATLRPLPVPAGDSAGGGGARAPGTGAGGAPGRVGPGTGESRVGGPGASAEPGGPAGRGVPVPEPDDGAGETTHFTVADGSGGIVSLTQSLGGPFGAGVPAGDLGFVLGRPGGEARAALPGDPVETGTPTERPAGGAGAPEVSRWMSPALVVRDTAELALGSPGGPRGVSAVVQVIASWTRAPRDLQRAVSEPRLHVGPGPAGRRGRLYLEGRLFEAADSAPQRPGAWTEAVYADGQARGFMATERDTGLYFQGVSPWFGGVNAVARVGSEWIPAADPRRDGAARRADEAATGSAGPVRPGAGGEGGRPQGL